MNAKVIIAWFFCCIFFAASAFAGSRSLNVVFINIGSRDIADEKFFKSYLDGDLRSPEKPKHCWEKLVGNGVDSDVFGMISGVKRPQGLDSKIGKKIWQGDKQAIDVARKILQNNFEYAPGKFVRESGYDGMFIFANDGKSITMMSVGAHGGKSKKIAIAIENENSEQTASDFSYAMCKIGAPLMIGFGV